MYALAYAGCSQAVRVALPALATILRQLLKHRDCRSLAMAYCLPRTGLSAAEPAFPCSLSAAESEKCRDIAEGLTGDRARCRFRYKKLLFIARPIS
jgi:hypothetical protein